VELPLFLSEVDRGFLSARIFWIIPFLFQGIGMDFQILDFKENDIRKVFNFSVYY